jgi:GNAT superfamily N-acetyltransferase
MIRHIRDDELPGLLKLYEFLHPEDARQSRDNLAVQKVWKTILADSNLRYYVADVDDRLVSTCTLALIPNLTRGLRPYGLIENVVTDPGHRKRGFAKGVIDYALQEAWAANCYKVMLLTGRKGEETLRFYEKAGFESGVKTGFVAYHPGRK